jgi:hypothetical protein
MTVPLADRYGWISDPQAHELLEPSDLFSSQHASSKVTN